MEAAATHAERFKFEAEVDRLLDLVVHSLYSNREVFLRELVSNASDALDKLRFRALTDPSLIAGSGAPVIRLIPDPKARTLTIEDTGIGMTREELISDLGTIARSGTKAFAEALKNAADTSDARLIGQFGVGFYSAFLIADRVSVVSRAAGHPDAWRWTSDAKGSFEVEPAERATHGASITLFLREDQAQFTETWTLRSLVKRYSDFVQHPIRLVTPASEEEEPTEETINRGTALWLKPKSDISEEDYQEFYRHLTHDWSDALAHTHFLVEGTHQFRGLLYLPKQPPFDMFMPDQRRGVRLYVQRVFVMDECEELLPQWLRFLRGVIDSEDLPLNVSREILQDSAATRAIQKAIVRKTLDLLESLAAERPDDYLTFWHNFGAVLKEGLHEHGDTGERLAKLARFESSTVEGLTSLAGYVERMVDGQPAIYYIVGRTKTAVAGSPHIEALARRGYEVLYFTDIVDEWASQALREFQGKPLVSALQADLSVDATDDERAAQGERAKAVESLLERFKAILGERVGEVRPSTRLTDSPICLVIPEGGLSAQMEQLLRAHRKELPSTKRILEVNPSHPLIEHLEALLPTADEGSMADWVELLYEQALITEGSPLPDPNAFAHRMTRLLQASLSR